MIYNSHERDSPSTLTLKGNAASLMSRSEMILRRDFYPFRTPDIYSFKNVAVSRPSASGVNGIVMAQYLNILLANLPAHILFTSFCKNTCRSSVSETSALGSGA